ncbi:MAG: DNA-packaging protein [Nitratireductor sp.]|nr:DNA-packaging protein [Nitratireductor sp.]
MTPAPEITATLWNTARRLRESLKRWLRQKTDGAGRLAAILTPAELTRIERDWPLWARDTQTPPPGNWRTWLMLGGRGAGKTRTGAQWLNGLANGDPHYPGDAAGRVALIGETYADARAVMIEGESGLLAIASPRERPQWSPSLRQLYWPASGAIGQVFSAADPEGLRGFQFGACWSDAKTIWGSLISVAAALAATFGIAIDTQSQLAIADAAVEIVGAAGALIAIYGRLTATRVIV